MRTIVLDYRNGEVRRYSLPSGSEIEEMSCLDVLLHTIRSEAIEHELLHHEITDIRDEDTKEKVSKETIIFSLENILDRFSTACQILRLKTD